MIEKLNKIELSVLLGAGMGFVYALISQFANRIVLSEITLHTIFPKPSYGILLITLGAALLGLIASLPRKIIIGVVLGAVLGGLAVTLVRFLNPLVAPISLIRIARIFFTTFIPMMFLFLALISSHQWCVGSMMKGYFQVHEFTANRFIPVLVTFLIVAIIGGLSIHSTKVRKDLMIVNAYLQEGRSAKSIAALPLPLQEVTGYLAHAQQSYALAPSNDLGLYYGELPEGVFESQISVVSVYFDDGFGVICLTFDYSDDLICQALVPVETRTLSD